MENKEYKEILIKKVYNFSLDMILSHSLMSWTKETSPHKLYLNS